MPSLLGKDNQLVDREKCAEGEATIEASIKILPRLRRLTISRNIKFVEKQCRRKPCYFREFDCTNFFLTNNSATLYVSHSNQCCYYGSARSNSSNKVKKITYSKNQAPRTETRLNSLRDLEGKIT
ncbi:hypothetical protein TSAR_008444 [Trichomalopsis sarcophagae]|uniref:Uncharacterized protein n=1 Tax=Trichomalopsis sarcophagae TaxID=543379 RepID=A0A232FPK8_9HYME|nr:hypothetical protein TSAR_008444 [Trichomalopsis sarcophagae]